MNSKYFIKIGDIVEVKDSLNPDSHCFEVSHVTTQEIRVQPYDEKIKLEDIIAVYRKCRGDFICVHNIENNEDDTAPLNAERMKEEIEEFYGIIKSSPNIYYDTLHAAFKYEQMAKRIRRNIEEVLEFTMKDWQFKYIFFDMPIPAEVINSRGCGKTIARILKLCLSQGVAIDINLKRAGTVDLLRLGNFMGEDGSTFLRAREFINQFRDVYRKLEKASIPLREIHFGRD